MIRTGNPRGWNARIRADAPAASATPGATSQHPLYRLTGHRGPVHQALWLRDGRILSTGGDWTMRLWDAATCAMRHTFRDPERTMSGHGGIRGAYELDGDSGLVTWGYDGVIAIWDLVGDAPVQRLVGHTEPVSGVLPVGSDRLLSWSGDGTIRLWRLDGSAHDVLSLSAAPDDLLSATPPFVDTGGRVLCWCYDELLSYALDGDGSVQRTSVGDADIVHALWVGDRALIAFDEAGRVSEWQGEPLARVCDYESIPARPMGAFVLADDRFAAWAAGRLRIWARGESAPIAVLDPPGDAVAGAVALPGGGLVYRTLGGKLVAWNGNEAWQSNVPRWREPIGLVACSDVDVIVWSPRASWLSIAKKHASTALTPGAGNLNGVAISSTWLDDRRLLSWSDDGEIHVWSDANHVSVDSSGDSYGGDSYRDSYRDDSSGGDNRNPRDSVIALHGAGSHLLAWHRDGALSLHDARDGRYVDTLTHAQPSVQGRGCGVTALGDERFIVWQTPSYLAVWDLARGECAARPTDSSGPLGPTITVGKEYAVSWSLLRDVGGFLLWNPGTGARLAVLDADQSPALGAAAVTGDAFVTWSESETIRLYGCDGRTIDAMELAAPVRGTALLGGDRFVSWTESELTVWSVRGNVQRDATVALDSFRDGIAGLAVSQDALLVWTESGDVAVFDQTSWDPLPGHYRAAGFVRWVVPLDSACWLIADDSGTAVAYASPGRVESLIAADALRYHASGAVVAPDRSWLAFPGERELAIIVAPASATERCMATIDMPARVGPLFAVSNTELAVALADGSVLIVATTLPASI